MNETDQIHRRFDGSVPREVRAALRAGGSARLGDLRLEGRRRIYDQLALDAVRGIAGRRRGIAAAGGPTLDGLRGDPGLFALTRDLRFYRDRGVDKTVF